jgi:uncharacterized membrane protein
MPQSFDRSAGSSTGARGQRLTGIDAARLVAIVGMIMVHFGPNPAGESVAGQIYDFSHGRAAVLFAFLAGIGVALLFRSRDSDQALLGRGQILLRAAILLPLGLWLQDLDHGVLVILQYYALYFVFLILIVGLTDRALLAVALIAIMVGPFVYHEVEQARPAWFEAGATTIGDPPSKIVRDLLISGSYPLVTWAAPLATGLWLGRRNLRSNQTRGLMVLVGLALAAATSIVERVGRAADSARVSELLSAEPHSQTHLWMIDAIGVAMVVLGLALVFCDVGGRLAWPFVAGGQLALSIYVGHLLLLHRYSDLLRREEVWDAYLSVGTFILATLIICVLWMSIFSRGPLEAALRAPGLLLERVYRRMR